MSAIDQLSIAVTPANGRNAVTPANLLPLNSVLFLIVAAVISGADGPAEIEDFGTEKREWLERFIGLPASLHSHDTIGRILSLIKPQSLQTALLHWINELRGRRNTDGPVVVPIDGKTVRDSYTDAGRRLPCILLAHGPQITDSH